MQENNSRMIKLTNYYLKTGGVMCYNNKGEIMSKIDLLIEKLNEEQLKPVLETEGAVLVIAGAGSGKTRVLTTRIAYLIAEKNVDPSKILAITFTNKAANELYDRVYQMLQKKREEVSSEEQERLQTVLVQMDRMHISTIHKFCLKIIKEFPFAVDMGLDVKISEESCEEQQERFLDSLCCDLDKKIKEWNKNIENALDKYGNNTTKKQERKAWYKEPSTMFGIFLFFFLIVVDLLYRT